MVTKNKTPIENLPVSKQDLIKIKNDLKNRNLLTYEQRIVKPFSVLLEHWIEKEYPSLINEREDLLFGAFRRLKNKLAVTDLSINAFDVNDYLAEFIEIECQSTIPNETNRKKNLGLDKAQFKKMIKALQDGDEALIEKVYLSHFGKCVAFLVSNKQCTKEIAYDCSIDALVEIRSDLLKGKIRYGNLGSYFTNRAVSKLYKKNRKNKIFTQPLTADINSIDHGEDESALLKRELKEMVNIALGKLCDECRFILKQFYYEETSLSEIGKKMNKNHDAVRKQATRCRDKLRKYIGEKFYHQYGSFFEN